MADHWPSAKGRADQEDQEDQEGRADHRVLAARDSPDCRFR